MCCTLSDGCPSISELSGVESRRSLGGVGGWIKGSRIRGGGGLELESESESESELELESESESEELRRCQNFAKSVEDQIRLLDSIFELKIIHAGK